jgi:hypothetical protein
LGNDFVWFGGCIGNDWIMFLVDFRGDKEMIELTLTEIFLLA